MVPLGRQRSTNTHSISWTWGGHHDPVGVVHDKAAFELSRADFIGDNSRNWGVLFFFVLVVRWDVFDFRQCLLVDLARNSRELRWQSLLAFACGLTLFLAVLWKSGCLVALPIQTAFNCIACYRHLLLYHLLLLLIVVHLKKLMAFRPWTVVFGTVMCWELLGRLEQF